MVKKEEVENITKKSKENKFLDNFYEVLSILPQVHSNIKDNVTQDYTLAHLREADEDFIRENYGNAMFSKLLLNRYADNGGKFVWNEEKLDWEKNEDGSFKYVPLDEKEKERIREIAQQIFDTFMSNAHMITILRRNKNKNFLVKLLGKAPEEIEKMANQVDERSLLQKWKDKLSENEEEEEND